MFETDDLIGTAVKGHFVSKGDTTNWSHELHSTAQRVDDTNLNI